MELTKKEKEQIKKFLQSEEFDLINRAKDELIRKFALQSCVGATEWETLSKTLSREFSIGGINSFFAYLVSIPMEEVKQD